MARAKRREYDPSRLWLGDSKFYLELVGNQVYVVHDGPELNDCLAGLASREVLMHVRLTDQSATTEEGNQIKAVSTGWDLLRSELLLDPKFRFGFPSRPSQFEEFIAGLYVRNSWDHVILTPRSGDKGRDVIAEKRSGLRARVLEQAKAYSPRTRVTHNHVRAMAWVVCNDSQGTSGRITTTSTFGPTITTGGEFASILPARLQLRDGAAFIDWVRETAGNDSGSIRGKEWGDWMPYLRLSKRPHY